MRKYCKKSKHREYLHPSSEEGALKGVKVARDIKHNSKEFSPSYL
jgi:hypothetical protein